MNDCDKNFGKIFPPIFDPIFAKTSTRFQKFWVPILAKIPLLQVVRKMSIFWRPLQSSNLTYKGPI